MTPTTIDPASAFERARTGLWASLQKHLALIYQAEAAFVKSVAFAHSFPFAPAEVEAGQLADYTRQRSALRDLFTDETTQLDTLTKAIRTKDYAEAEKKQLYLLLLGYLDVAATVFERLSVQVPRGLPKDEELEATQVRFERVRNFARLNVKGIAGLLG
ncbi:hypothetical protein QMK33_22810 [Hymenobacter sp. H14-R3]|uniref:hypothetical protein n=1 Tax=Hymenobacter sp. H14-R3 TaxID=3046308 RepID=UPI0024B90218|nr:hypothetical protein [Hymenobacter sp. H14-R3]MDJ0367983.1 hypothetical protein [Hymenobacter sp. H14-R3]